MRSAAKFYKQLRRSGPNSLAGERRQADAVRASKAELTAASPCCVCCTQTVVHAVGGLRTCWQLGHHSRGPAEHRQHASSLPTTQRYRCDNEPPAHVGAAH